MPKHRAEEDSSPLRVLVVGPIPPPNGGIATVVQDILSIDFGGTIEIGHFNDRAVALPRGLVFRLANAATSRIGPFALCSIGIFWRIREFRRALERFRPNVVHIHASSASSFWSQGHMARFAKSHGFSTVLHCHGGDMDVRYENSSRLSRALVRFFLRVPERCVVLSESWRSWYAHFVPAERLEVVPNCIGWQRFQQGSAVAELDRPRVLFVGMMEARRKGIYDLIGAAPRVLEEFPDTEFLLVGSDDERVEASLNVDPTVRSALNFAGNFDREQVEDAYHRSTLLVLPAYSEGMPMVLLESMASGLPVVCTRVNAIPEVVEHGVNGLLIEAGDQTALAEKILELLRAPELRRRLGEAARQHIHDHHNLASIPSRLAEIYRGAAVESL